MSDYYDLMRIVDKEVISVKELHRITNDELVSQISEIKPDQKRNPSRLFPTFSAHPNSRKRQAVKEEERGEERHIVCRRKNHCV